MSRPAVEQEIMDEVRRMPEAKQREVLDFARTIAGGPSSRTPVQNLARLAGLFTPEDAEEMMRAIEEGCERIDHDGW